MGAFFTNCQVLVAGSTERTARAVISALESLADGQNLRLAEEGEEADHSIAVRTSERWISVYDEHTESQDERLLTDLAQQLSAATGSYVVSVLVHDSDVLPGALRRRLRGPLGSGHRRAGKATRTKAAEALDRTRAPACAKAKHPLTRELPRLDALVDEASLLLAVSANAATQRRARFGEDGSCLLGKIPPSPFVIARKVERLGPALLLTGASAA